MTHMPHQHVHHNRGCPRVLRTQRLTMQALQSRTAAPRAARPAAPARLQARRPLRPVRALEIDFSDVDTQLAFAGVFLVSAARRCIGRRAQFVSAALGPLAAIHKPSRGLRFAGGELKPQSRLSGPPCFAGCPQGLGVGIGAPIWYINRVEKDEERLEELRALNRATFQETGEYMSEVGWGPAGAFVLLACVGGGGGLACTTWRAAPRVELHTWGTHHLACTHTQHLLRQCTTEPFTASCTAIAFRGQQEACSREPHPRCYAHLLLHARVLNPPPGPLVCRMRSPRSASPSGPTRSGCRDAWGLQGWFGSWASSIHPTLWELCKFSQLC